MRKLILICLVATLLQGCATKNNIEVIETGTAQSAPVSDSKFAVFINNPQGYLGVSDPGFDSTLACQQAIQRALLTCALMKELNISLVTDYYTHVYTEHQYDTQNEKITFMANFNTQLSGYEYTVNNVFLSKYGEAFVWLDIIPMSNKNRFSVDGDCLYSVYETRTTSISKILNLKITQIENGITCQSGYQCKNDDNTLLQTCAFDSTMYSIPDNYYVYENTINQSDTLNTFDLQNGFWYAYMYAFTNALSGIYTSSFVSKSSNDIMNYQFDGAISQSIIRQSARAKTYCVLSRIAVLKNQLHLDWQFVEQ